MPAAYMAGRRRGRSIYPRAAIMIVVGETKVKSLVFFSNGLYFVALLLASAAGAASALQEWIVEAIAMASIGTYLYSE